MANLFNKYNEFFSEVAPTEMAFFLLSFSHILPALSEKNCSH